jgi:uncharacterized membrane protein
MSQVDDQEDASARKLRTQRLEAFNDGVFAIAITLLVLDIAVPVGAAKHPLQAIVDEWPAYLAYLVSFATIGALWVGHSLITEYLERADAVLIRLNLLFLLVVAFLPFPTRLLAEYRSSADAERVAVTIYGVTLLVAFALLAALWQYALREKLVRPDADDAELAAVTGRLEPSLVGYGALIVLGLFLPRIAVIGYLLIALYFLIPLGRGRLLI